MVKMIIETEKDIQVLKAIGKVGFLTDDLFPFLEISKQRIYQLVENDYIIKKGPFMVFGKLTSIYTLTDTSKRRLRSDYLLDLYKSDTTQLEHDYVLAKIYMYLSFEEKESWKTETALIEEYKNAEKTTDALYISKDGNKIGVEVVSDSYSKNEIEQKKDFIRNFCDDFIMIHSHKDIEYKL